MTNKTLQEILADIANAIETNNSEQLNWYKEEYATETDDETFTVDADEAEAILKQSCREYEPETIATELKELLELVYHAGGGEGSGEDEPQVVWQYKPTEQLVGFQGWYASHHGTDWDNDFQEWEVHMVPEYARKRS